MRPITFPAYFQYYIALHTGDDIVAILQQQLVEMEAVFAAISEEKAAHSYQTGKWTIKELLGHITDTERIISYRALRFSRRDNTPLPGFEEDDYVKNAHYSRRSLANIWQEFVSVRHATLTLAASFTAEDMPQIGTANGKQVDVAAILYMIAGHTTHHIKVLREKYLQD